MSPPLIFCSAAAVRIATSDIDIHLSDQAYAILLNIFLISKQKVQQNKDNLSINEKATT